MQYIVGDPETPDMRKYRRRVDIARKYASTWPNEEMVEAAGVEPASEKVCREKTTCVSGSLFFVHPMRNQQD